MKNFKGLQIKPDRLILIENGHEIYIKYDEMPEIVKRAVSDIIVFSKYTTDMENSVFVKSECLK